MILIHRVYLLLSAELRGEGNVNKKVYINKFTRWQRILLFLELQMGFFL
jgi:hypothetical protein